MREILFGDENESKVRILGAGIGLMPSSFLLNLVIIWRNLGVGIIICYKGTAFYPGWWRIMVMREPKPEMFQNSLDNMVKFNKGDSTEHQLAVGHLL